MKAALSRERFPLRCLKIFLDFSSLHKTASQARFFGSRFLPISCSLASAAAHFEFLRAAEAVAPSLGVQVSAIRVRDTAETERGIAQFADTPNAGLIVLPHPVNISNRALLVELTARLRLPAIYPYNYFPASGGLISYGFDQLEQWRGAASYVDRILRGAKPADLPVQAPTKYELIVNLRAAQALGLAISPSLLAAAHEVIE